MKKKTRRQIWHSYLHQNMKTLLLGLIFAGVFILITVLYQMHLEPVIYATILCLMLAVIWMCIDFFGFYHETRHREQILQNIELNYENLPLAHNLQEEDYQAMIQALGHMRDRELTRFTQEQRDSVDYYTTWVHQIKTPIAVMKMMLQEEDTPENLDLLVELFRIEQYVELALNYIRLEGTDGDLVIKTYELDELLRGSIRKFAPQFIRRKLKVDFFPTNQKIITDEKWFSFIIEQLLSNAVKYTSLGGVTIKMEDHILEIRDTGMGIAKEDLPRIFEKGYTGYNGHADKKATGLGLYLCKKTSQKLGIRIWASSEPGEGTSIYLDLSPSKLEIE